MQSQITYVESCKCTWCEKENEGVEATFGSGFLTKGTKLCFKCLQQALRVDHKQTGGKQPADRAGKESS